MAYKLGWYVPERVIYIRLEGTFTVDDLAQISDALIKMLDSGKPLVHILRDERNITSTPRNLQRARDVMRVGNHRAIGWVVATGNTNAMLQFLMGMMASFFGLNYRHFRTIEAGIAFLQARDPSIRWDDADQTLLSDAQNGNSVA